MWTKNFPGKDGYYWFRTRGSNVLQIVEICGDWILFCGEEPSFYKQNYQNKNDLWWSEPVNEPNIPHIDLGGYNV